MVFAVTVAALRVSHKEFCVVDICDVKRALFVVKRALCVVKRALFVVERAIHVPNLRCVVRKKEIS